MKQLVIIAGGKGTRLQSRLGDQPKALALVGGKPLIQHQVELAQTHGFGKILVLTGVGADHIERHLGDGSAWGVSVTYHRDPRPIGTAGALVNAYELLDDQFLVMYADTMLNVNLRRLASSHPADAQATLFLHPNDHPHDSDLVEVDDDHRVTAIHPYPHPTLHAYRNLVNAALYVFEKCALEPFRAAVQDLSSSFDIAKHLFPALLKMEGSLHGYLSREYIRDAGTPERLDRVNRQFEMGRIAQGSIDVPVPAIFFDRDGTLNHERGFLKSPDNMELLPGAAEAVRLVNESGMLAVVITNQAVIARGDCTEADLRRIHNRLEWQLGEARAYLDAIYYCPHHPDRGFEGERADLKFACTCRKPAPDLLAAAVSDMNIATQESWMVGDRVSDVQLAANFGIKSALVLTGHGANVRHLASPTLECSDVLSAVRHIVGQRAGAS